MGIVSDIINVDNDMLLMFDVNRLCVATLKVLKFRNDNEALFAMFDGGHNNEVPKILLEKIPAILKEELANEKTCDQYMKYTMLTAHKLVSIHMQIRYANEEWDVYLSLNNKTKQRAVSKRYCESLVCIIIISISFILLQFVTQSV